MTAVTGIPKPYRLHFTTMSATTGAINPALGWIDFTGSANAAYTLPPLRSADSMVLSGAILSVRNLTAFTVTLNCVGDDTIDGDASYVVGPVSTVTFATSNTEYTVQRVCDLS